MFMANRAGVAAALLVTVLSLPARADEKVVAKVDGQPITASELDTAMASMAQQLAQLPEEQRKKAAIGRLVDMKVIAAQAARDGLDKSDEYKRRMDALRQQLLINEYVRVKVSALVTDQSLKARYDEEIKKLTLGDEWHARHILVKTKAEAEGIIADLGKGGDFAKIAEEKSQDPGSAKQGGDLGFFSAGDMVKPFEEAAAALKPGEYTKAPIETQFGFHVIKLEETRKQQPPAFDDVKEQLRQDEVGRAFSGKLDELKKAAKVEIDDAALSAK